MMWRKSCLGTEACSLLLSGASASASTGAGPSAWGRKTLGGTGGPAAADRDAPCLKTSSELVVRATLVGLATALAAACLTAKGDQIQYLMPCVQIHISFCASVQLAQGVKSFQENSQPAQQASAFHAHALLTQ